MCVLEHLPCPEALFLAETRGAAKHCASDNSKLASDEIHVLILILVSCFRNLSWITGCESHEHLWELQYYSIDVYRIHSGCVRTSVARVRYVRRIHIRDASFFDLAWHILSKFLSLVSCGLNVPHISIRNRARFTRERNMVSVAFPRSKWLDSYTGTF